MSGPDLKEVTLKEMVRGARDTIVSLGVSSGDAEDGIRQWAIHHDLEPESFQRVINEVATGCLQMVPNFGDLTQEQIDVLGVQLQGLILMGAVYGANRQKEIDHGV